MNLPRSIRVLIAMAVLVLGLAALLLLLTISEATLNIRAHLDEAPAWLRIGWWTMIGAVSLLTGWLLWRILRPGTRSRPGSSHVTVPVSAAQIEEKIARAEELGADTSEIRRELSELQRRREAGEVHVAMFGEISTGKSALVHALLPQVQTSSDVRGGTTREIRTFAWRSPGGDTLLISDTPGTAEVDGSLDQQASDEAKRAHIVIYVTDGDINRSQHRTLLELIALRKPMILVLNKTDRYSAQEVEQITEHLQSLIRDHSGASLVSVSAASSRRVIRQLADGSEREEERRIEPQVGALASALQRMIDGDQAILDQLRDTATFVLAAEKLDQTLAVSRKAKADKLVDSYSVKAVFGALAAITPGSDLIIQGWLGTQLIRDLAALYDTKVGKVDTELLLKLVQKHVGRAHTLILAMAGNALKAFPGVGTLAGGALHAVAYGIIFRTLGRALITTLETRGELRPRQTAQLFEEKLGEDLETSARSLARLVVEQTRNDRSGKD